LKVGTDGRPIINDLDTPDTSIPLALQF